MNTMITRFGLQLSLALLIFLHSEAQTTLTLDYCQKAAREFYPLLSQKGLLKQSSDLSYVNIGKAYLPQLMFNGSATYQSEVIVIPFEVPGLETPTLPKDHYQFTLDVNQTVYDGGGTKSRREIEEANLQSEQQKVEVELFQLRKQVDAIYFAILFGDQTIEQLKISRADLEKKYEQIAAAVREGAAIRSSADQVKAEMLKLDQKITEAEAIKVAYVKSLALLIQDTLDAGSVKLEVPTPAAVPDYSIQSRPDFILLQKQQYSLEAMKHLTMVPTTPQLGVFAQGGYGLPGLDPFNTSFSPFYVVGARLRWNIFNWNESKNQREIYSIRLEILNQQINTLDVNTRLQTIQQLEEIEKLKKLITQDAEQIELRKSISLSASSQVDNGVITVTDYLTQVNAQYQAELLQRIHQLQLAFAYVNYQTILGL